jgi:hypothetical protein
LEEVPWDDDLVREVKEKIYRQILDKLRAMRKELSMITVVKTHSRK